MASSVRGWTMPDWSIFDNEQLANERARHQNMIENNRGNEKASDNIARWKAVIESITAELEFRKLAK